MQHPRVAAPVTYARAPGERPPGRASVVKETGFLELYGGKRGALQQYAAKFFVDLRPAKLGVDATPHHLYRKKRSTAETRACGAAALAQHLACAVPSARLVVTTRDPVARTWSDYLFYGRLMLRKAREACFDAADGFEPSAAHFDAAVTRQVEVIDACMAGVRFTALDDNASSAPEPAAGARKPPQPPYARTGGWRTPPLGRAPTLKECVHLWEEQVRALSLIHI